MQYKLKEISDVSKFHRSVSSFNSLILQRELLFYNLSAKPPQNGQTHKYYVFNHFVGALSFLQTCINFVE